MTTTNVIETVATTVSKMTPIEERVMLLADRIETQIASGIEKLKDASKSISVRLDSARAHLRLAWSDRCSLGGPTADPALRNALGKLCRTLEDLDDRARYFADLEKKFGEADKLMEELVAEDRRLKAIEWAQARSRPKAGTSPSVGRGVRRL